MKKVKSIITFLLIIVLVFTGSIGEVQDEIYAKQIEQSSDNKNMKTLYQDTKINRRNCEGWNNFTIHKKIFPFHP